MALQAPIKDPVSRCTECGGILKEGSRQCGGCGTRYNAGSVLVPVWNCLGNPALREGMKVMVLLKDGGEIPCMVVRRPIGGNMALDFNSLVGDQYSPALSRIQGWRVMPDLKTTAGASPWWHHQHASANVMRMIAAGIDRKSREWMALARAHLESLLSGEKVVGAPMPCEGESRSDYDRLAQISAALAMAARELSAEQMRAESAQV